MIAIVRGGATLLAALLLSTSIAAAAAPDPAVAAPDSTATHEAAARELFQLVSGPRVATAAADAMLKSFRDQPEMAPYEDVARRWCAQVFSGEEFERETARLYMRYFSEEDLRGLTAFYRTPLGQRALESMPVMMAEGAELGRRLAERHQDELVRMLEQARKGGKGTPSKTELKKKD